MSLFVERGEAQTLAGLNSIALTALEGLWALVPGRYRSFVGRTPLARRGRQRACGRKGRVYDRFPLSASQSIRWDQSEPA